MPRLQSTRLCWPLAPAPKGREKEATHLIAWLGYYEPKVEISPSKAHKSALFQIFCSKPTDPINTLIDGVGVNYDASS
jgi:hypothetical protein